MVLAYQFWDTGSFAPGRYACATPFFLILSYLHHTPFINDQQGWDENIHTQTSQTSFPYSPGWTGGVW